MQQFIDNLASLSVGEARIARNLAVFPVFSGLKSALEYQTLSEAVASGGARIREVSESGVVSDIVLENRSSKPILILDGEELIGAKQNRTANVTILAPAGKTTRIPVTCVEAGRWSSGPTDFGVAERVHYSRGRARKMETVSRAMESGSRHADQGMVWDDIREKSVRMSVESPTGAISDVFEGHAASLSDYVEKLRAEPGQTGAVFAIDGRVEGLEFFDSAATFAKLHPQTMCVGRIVTS